MPFKKTVLLLALAVALFGCAGAMDKVTVQVSRLEHGQNIEASPGTAVVFGRILIVQDGIPTAPYQRYDEPILGLIHLDTDKRARGGMVEHDGNFYWSLPRGTYLVDAVHSASNTFIPQTLFRVPAGADAYYLGTLVIDYKIKVKRTGTRYMTQLNFQVADEFEKAENALRYHSPGFRSEARKSLMVIDERLPDNRDETLTMTNEVRKLLDVPPPQKK